MELSSVQHLMDSPYSHVVGEREAVIRLRAKKQDIKRCLLFHGDRACATDPVIMDSVELPLVARGEFHDYFEVALVFPYTRICYYFWLSDGENSIYYYGDRFSHSLDVHRSQFFQLPFLHRNDVLQIPSWAKELVIYHIFPDSFADGKRRIASASRTVEAAGGRSRNRLGGSLNGIKENLDYLAALGINAIYLNPIFAANSYHKYDTIDYFTIDPCFGTKEDFKNLVNACHARGIRVILDGVFNHTGPDFFAFKDILRHGQKSKYAHWYYQLNFPLLYQDNPNYACFCYVKEMPKLNTAHPEVIDYFCKVGAYWIKEADIDGWRLDVANEVDHEFWRAFRKAVRKEKADVFLIGEVWEDAQAWLAGDQFDSTMNYRFTSLCMEYFAQERISLDLFDNRIHDMLMRYRKPFTAVQMNFLDTHDVPRFFHWAKGDLRRVKLAVFFLMMAPGIPSLFYGDEKGLTGSKEEEYRGPMEWQQQGDARELVDFYSTLIAIRKRFKAAMAAGYETVLKDEGKKVYIFKRFDPQAKEVVYCGFNRSDFLREVELELPETGRSLVDLFTNQELSGTARGRYTIALKPWGVNLYTVA